jgi:hypothetical protein
MRIEPNLSTVSFDDASAGCVLIARMGPRRIVQGMKAAHSEGGAEASYFVTLGPFFEEHGRRPVVYDPADLETSLMFDASSNTRLVYAPRPEVLLIKDVGQVQEEGHVGELLFASGKSLLSVANFGRAGAGQVAYLDLDSGELTGLPDSPCFFSVSQWRVETLDAAGDVVSAEEFSGAE